MSYEHWFRQKSNELKPGVPSTLLESSVQLAFPVAAAASSVRYSFEASTAARAPPTSFEPSPR